ncbi:MAG: thioredoxin [bacterium]
MCQISLLLLSALVLAGCGDKVTTPQGNTSSPSKVVALNTANFESQIAKGVVLVDFWAPWCGPCRTQGPIVEEVAGQLQGKAVVAKVNVDENQAVAEKFNIQGIPTLIVFKDGKPAKQFVGVNDAATLISAVTAALEAP